MVNFQMFNLINTNLLFNNGFVETESIYSFIDMMPVGMSFTTDVACRNVRHNPHTERFLRIDSRNNPLHCEFRNTDLIILRQNRELSLHELPLHRAMWLGEEVEGEELDFVWQDGIRKIGLWSARPLRDENGSICAALAFCEDITSSKLNEEKFIKCLDATLDCLSILKAVRNDKGKIIDLRYEYINEPGCKNHQRSSNEHIGRNISELFPSALDSGLYQMYCRVIETGEPLYLETLYLPNPVIPTMIDIYDIKASKLGDGIAVSWRNITEKKRLEHEISHLDRLNTVSSIAASIGHEIRNPLTTVRGYLQLFAKKKEYKNHQEQFHTMIEELDRANHIITEFLSLAKNKLTLFEKVNLNDIITALLPLLQADAFRNGHEIIAELNDIPELTLDEKEIRQVLLNLVRNAEEAMSPGGAIIIKTGLSDGQIFLSIQDSGPGIPENILNNLGTPFLTTKQNGTGLGLAVCYRIAAHNNAKINVKSSSQGTTFSLLFNHNLCVE